MAVHSGDRCPKCQQGRMKVLTSRRVENYQRQWLGCSKCEHKEAAVVAAEKVWRRV